MPHPGLPQPSPAPEPRVLVYLPVIHGVADLGALGTPVRTATSAVHGVDAWRKRVHTVEEMWAEIERLIESLDLDPSRTRLYQDGLPVCPHELEIVKEMTYKGSRNHRILLRLANRGAHLMGTESGPMLLQEYNLAKRLLAPEREDLEGDGRDALQIHAQELLKARDRFIAERINETLGPGELGILFLGMLHDVAPWLEPDIQVAYPLGTPIGADAVAAAPDNEIDTQP